MDQQSSRSQKLAREKRSQLDSIQQEAEGRYQQILSIDPDNVAANYAVALRLLNSRRDALARKYLEKVVACDPGHFRARLKLLEIAFDLGERETQSALLRDLMDTTSEVLQLRKLADTVRTIAMPAAAAEILQKCLEIDRGQYEVHCSLARLYVDRGESERAARHLVEAVDIAPQRVEAYTLRVRLGKVDQGSAEAAAMQQLYRSRGNLEDDDRAALNFALGRLLERGGESEQAFAHYREANGVLADMLPYSAEENRRRLRGIEAVFSKAFFRATPLVSSHSKCPIFLVGMPCSGASRVERMLAGHPRVFSAGELADFDDFVSRIEAVRSAAFFEDIQDYKPVVFKRLAGRYLSKIRAISDGAEHVTDRTLENFRYIGLITLVFPHARIIHCRRDPVETCLSIYTNESQEARAYASKLASLGHYYADYARLMRHWHDALPFRIYDVRFEDILADPEGEVRALLNFCDLPFDSACLEIQEDTAGLSTAGAARDGPALGVESAQRRARFEKQLAPLLEVLQEEGVIESDNPPSRD